LRVKLARLDDAQAARERNAARYRQVLGLVPAEDLALPQNCGARHTYHQFSVRVRSARPGRDRDALRAPLTEAGIGTDIYYPSPLHRQPCFAAIHDASSALPVAEAACAESLALPIFPGLTEDEITEVGESIVLFFR